MSEKTKKRPRGKPFVKGDPRAGRPLGRLNNATVEARELARNMILDEVYLRKLKADLLAMVLPPPLVAMLFHYAFGKPKETHELTGADGGPIEVLTRIERIIVDGKNAKD